MNRPHSELAIVVDERPSHHVLSLTGCLDLTTVSELRGAILKSIAGQPSAIVVDLRGTSIGEDIALTVFPAMSRQAAAWPGCAIRLVSTEPSTLAALDRMAIGRSLPIYHTVDAATGAADSAPWRLIEHLPPTMEATALARHMVAYACNTWSRPHCVDLAELVVTELVGNVVRHARTEMTVTISLRNRYLHLAVRDHDPRPPRLGRAADVSGDSGRGLMVVEAVAVAWGCTPTADGKVVWATLCTDPGEYR